MPTTFYSALEHYCKEKNKPMPSKDVRGNLGIIISHRYSECHPDEDIPKVESHEVLQVNAYPESFYSEIIYLIDSFFAGREEVMQEIKNIGEWKKWKMDHRMKKFDFVVDEKDCKAFEYCIWRKNLQCKKNETVNNKANYLVYYRSEADLIYLGMMFFNNIIRTANGDIREAPVNTKPVLEKKSAESKITADKINENPKRRTRAIKPLAIIILLFFSSISLTGCNRISAIDQISNFKDSTWPVISWKKKITKDTLAGVPFEYWQEYHEIDSGEWKLLSVSKGLYKYFKLYSYGTIESIHCKVKPIPDTLLKSVDPFLFTGIDYLVGHITRRYLLTKKLLKGCKITDTIPEAIEIYGTNHTREFYVGGKMGERVRSEIIETPTTFYFDECDSIVMLTDCCVYFDKKPNQCYTKDNFGRKTFYVWDVCHNLTELYFTPKKLKISTNN